MGYDSNTLTVTFTDAGRSKLQKARTTDAGLQAHVAFHTTIVSIPANGTITNTANVAIPGGTVNTDVVDGGKQGPTSTKFAPLTLTKTGSDSPAADALTGATFQLYLCQQDQNTKKWQLQGNPLQIATTPTGSPTNALTTGKGEGAQPNTFNGYGLPVSSFAGGSAGAVGNTYCVLETKAPSGYIANPEIQPVTYTEDGNTFTVTVNDQKNTVLGQLPATGAVGIVIVFLVGGALVLRGIMTSRRDDDDNAQQA